jgi:hypothetical protein
VLLGSPTAFAQIRSILSALKLDVVNVRAISATIISENSCLFHIEVDKSDIPTNVCLFRQTIRTTPEFDPIKYGAQLFSTIKCLRNSHQTFCLGWTRKFYATPNLHLLCV